MDRSGVGITDDSIASLGFCVHQGQLPSGIKAWSMGIFKNDRYEVAGVKYESSTSLWLYDNNGFFTAYVSRNFSDSYEENQWAGVQIAVIKDIDHLRDIIRVLSVDWRAAKEGN